MTATTTRWILRHTTTKRNLSEGDGNDNVISKYKFALLLSLRDYFNLFHNKGVVVPTELLRSVLGEQNVQAKKVYLGEKVKIYLQVLTSSIKPHIWLFHVVVLLTTAKKWTKVKNARAGCAKLLFLPTKYANLSRFRCRRRYRCLSFLISLVKRVKQTWNTQFTSYFSSTPQNNDVNLPNLRF